MGYTERQSLMLNSSLETITQLEAAAERLAAEAGLDEEQRFHVALAVREAAINAFLHGNLQDPAKQIRFSLQNTGADLVFTIADQGKGLPDSLPDPLAPENLLRGSGRGIFLIRSLMDEVHFRQLDSGTELTLVKHLTPAADQS